MAVEEQAENLPVRPRSAFAPAPESEEVIRGKDGRRLGGAVHPEFVKSYWTEERREEARQKALKMIEEGRFGGANGFHRRKTKRFQEIAAEHAQQKADEIVKKLDAMIDQPKDKRLQLEAIREYARFEDWAVKNAREDEKAFRAMTNAQLESRLLETFGEALGIDLSDLMPEVIEGTATEVEVNGDGEYDPMNAELGGDRLREAAEEIEDLDSELVAQLASEMAEEDVVD